MPVQFDVLAWLNRYLGYVSDIHPDKINAVTNFSLLWNLFESSLGDDSMGIRRIGQIAIDISTKPDCNQFYLEYFRYLKNRYLDSDGDTNTLFNDLSFRNNDKKDFVAQVLKSDGSNPAESIEALLIVVYRLRNNLFHGVKELYSINSQYDNFNNANIFLAKILDLSKT